MKHMIRKPLLPILLLIVLCVSSGFLALFQEGLREDRLQMEALYDNAKLTIELLPGVDSGDQLRLQTHKGDFLESLDSIRATLRVLECDGAAEGVSVRIYGTNDPDWLARHKSLELTYLDSWDRSFSDTDGRIPCILGTVAAEKLGIGLGDSTTLIPVNFMGVSTDSAPHVELTVVGICEDPTHAMDGGILVPEEIFLGGPKLLYNPDMMYNCYYRTFVLELDPTWNRSYEEVEEEVRDILYDVKEFELVSNHRTLRRAVGPMERKLAVQEKLVLPLELLFLAACAGISMMICMGMETEVFLRRMWGERGTVVFGTLWGSLLLWLTVCGVLATAASAIAGAQWLPWAAVYAGTAMLLCALAAAAVLRQSCRRNLVELYQSKEGE